MKLIPPIIREETKSDAERAVFEWLQNSKLNGIAIHSLDLSKHTEKLYSEIDFVIITERGVLCLEVKGGAVGLEQGKWVYTTRFGKSSVKEESPFTQARTNKESLMHFVRERYTKANGSEIKRCLYGYGVVFPDTVFHERGAGIDLDLVFDRSMTNFDDYLERLYDVWESRLSVRFDLEVKHQRLPRLNSGLVGLLSELLVGKTGTNKEGMINKNFVDIDGRLNALTEDQYKVFQFGIQNRRQLIEGGAGTGKTMIGIMYALEKAKEGNRVLFLCFNILLAEWIKEMLAAQMTGVLNIKVASFHEYLLELTGSDKPENPDVLDDFYKSQLPNAFIEVADQLVPFDVMVVDEGQDLLFENYLLCLDQFVTGGLDHGNWVILYDENQNIYLKERFNQGLNAVLSYQPFLGQLRENYRNTRQIDQANGELTQIRSKAFAGIDGEPVEIYGYKDNNDGQTQLKSVMKDLRKKGVTPKDIVILSSRRFEHSMLEGKSQLLEGIGPIYPMQNKDGRFVKVPDHAIRFSSIYSFKGLESHVVIIIDAKVDDEHSRKLTYTGISRAKSKLVVFRKG